MPLFPSGFHGDPPASVPCADFVSVSPASKVSPVGKLWSFFSLKVQTEKRGGYNYVRASGQERLTTLA
jgi:hypothetical protein